MFWIIAAILILIALIIVLPPLLKPGSPVLDARREQNILIAKEQLAELEGRFEKGEMDEESYQSTRDELELALFDDVDAEDVKSANTGTNPRSGLSFLGSTIIALLIPAIAIAMYSKLGNPVFTQALSSKQAAREEIQKEVPKKADGSPDIDAMVAGLQKKMEANPDNAKGWFMLGRSYMVLKRYPEASKAFEQAYVLMPQSTDAMLSLADSLSMASQGNISGRPTELINKVLEIEPDNLTGLWLGGMAARQQGDSQTAIKRWKRVLLQITSPEEIQQVESLISEAMKQLTPEQKLALQATQPKTDVVVKTSEKLPKENSSQGNTKQGITVNISLSDKLKSQTSPEDLVFIYAKAVSGPPMPLAAARKQVKDLPLKLVLDDSMAMMPAMKLSGFSEVVVGARISKSGQPIAQNGDLFTEKKPIKAGESVALEIDSVVQK